MSIPFAIHRSGSAVPVGRLRGLHSGCALGLVPASGDLLRFARGLSVFGTDVRRSGVPEGVDGAAWQRTKSSRSSASDRLSCCPLAGVLSGAPLARPGPKGISVSREVQGISSQLFAVLTQAGRGQAGGSSSNMVARSWVARLLVPMSASWGMISLSISRSDRRSMTTAKRKPEKIS
jgi:hypothetical protein